MVDELRALEHSPSFYNASAPNPKSKKKKGILKKGGAALSIVAVLGFGLIAVFYGAGQLVPDFFKTSLVDATDLQCVNGIIDKEWAFIETLRQGSAPADTIENLKGSGYLIGRVDENNQFIEDPHGTLLKSGDALLSGDELFEAFQNDADLFKAFDSATYSCIAYYFDEPAEQTFNEIGVSRNSYYSEDSFDDALSSIVEGTSNISINNVTKTEQQVSNNGQTETKIVYQSNGDDINIANLSAEELVDSVRTKNAAATTTESALNTADVLKVADTMTKEQRSSRLYLYFMENIDKMKAGEGENSNIHDVMTFLTTAYPTEVVDVNTGEIIKENLTPLDAPSLNAILSGKSINAEESKNYSSDRILKTIENKLNLDTAAISPVKNPVANAITSTVSSFSKSSGTIARFLSNGLQTIELAVLSPIIPTISNSLIKNQAAFYGVTGGEMIVEGAVNVGRKLAMHGSGAAASDEAAAVAYHKQVKQIAALRDEVERKTLSPFDITSKNTFFGAIARQFLPIVTKTSSLPTLVMSTVASLTPNTYADDTAGEILTSFGDCSTYATIGAVGTAHCSLIASFDTSTSHDPYNNQEYLNFVAENTYIDDAGNRQVKYDSYLANYILYNNNRITPFGTTDAGILANIKQHFNFLQFLSNPSTIISLFDSASAEDKAIASGAAFVNSASNPYWNNYKYAQRYVSINRAVAALKAYSTDTTAYQNLPGCEGTINSVVAFTEKYYQEHPKATFAGITIESKEPKETPQKEQELSRKTFNTRNNHLVVSKVLHQTPTSHVIKFGEYIIKQNDWTLA